MQYITSFERHGREKGIQQGIQQGFQQGIVQGFQQGLTQGKLERAREDVLEVLRLRFEHVPVSLFSVIDEIDLPFFLKQLHKTAVMIESIDAFLKVLEDKNSL